MEDARAACPREVTVQAFDDPEERQDGERKRGPVDETTRTLVRNDGEESPCNGDGTCEVTFRSRKGVRGSGCLEEEEAKEDENLGPDTCAVR